MTTDTADWPRFISFSEALTDFVRAEGNAWTSAAGGSGWNVARAAAALDVPSAWAGCVSADPFGDEIIQLSAQAGLDMRFANQVDRPPLLAMVHDTQPPNYYFLGRDSADLAFDPEALPKGWSSSLEIAHFGCISLIRQPLGARLVRLAEQLAADGVAISLDPNVRNLMDRDFTALCERLAAIARLIKLSDEDLAALYPDRNTDAALQQVIDIAPNALVVYTRGADGLAAFDAGNWIEQAAIAAPAPGDTIGAGDAAVGALIASLVQQPEATTADRLRFTAAAAALACAHTGAQVPSRAAVDALLSA